MLLSIIIPVYNAENYVSKCLDSLLLQNLKTTEYEILIMDDGSTDNTFDIVQKYVDQNHNIKFFQQKNEGPCSARNALLKKVRGEYVYFMDADDLMVFNSLGTLVRLAQRLSLDVIGFDTLVTADITDFDQNKLFTTAEQPKVIDGYQYLAENPSFRVEVWWYLMKTSFLKDNNICFDKEEYNRDVLFTLNTFSKAKRVVHISETLHCYFQSEISIMRNKDLSHRRILIENVHTMIEDFTYFISKLRTEKIPNKELIIKNLENRRNEFVVFFLGKLVRSGLNVEQAKVYLKKLKEIEAYPLRSSNHIRYSPLRKIAVIMLNKEYFLLPAIELRTFQYNLVKSA